MLSAVGLRPPLVTLDCVNEAKLIRLLSVVFCKDELRSCVVMLLWFNLL